MPSIGSIGDSYDNALAEATIIRSQETAVADVADGAFLARRGHVIWSASLTSPTSSTSPFQAAFALLFMSATCGSRRHPGHGLFWGALQITTNALYKAELVRQQGPWRGVDDLELATLGWVHWFNSERLPGTLSDIPPVEFEAAYHHQQETSQPVGIQ